jgi:hypothetical protein
MQEELFPPFMMRYLQNLGAVATEESQPPQASELLNIAYPNPNTGAFKT